MRLVLSGGKPRFETEEVEPPRKERYRTKKRLKMQRKREKRKRKEANRRDPRCIRVKGKKKKPRFPNAEARLKYKIEMVSISQCPLPTALPCTSPHPPRPFPCKVELSTPLPGFILISILFGLNRAMASGIHHSAVHQIKPTPYLILLRRQSL